MLLKYWLLHICINDPKYIYHCKFRELLTSKILCHSQHQHDSPSRGGQVWILGAHRCCQDNSFSAGRPLRSQNPIHILPRNILQCSELVNYTLIHCVLVFLKIDFSWKKILNTVQWLHFWITCVFFFSCLKK